MELSNSNTEKKALQLEIFNKFASKLPPEAQDGVNSQVLLFEDFIKLISSSRTLYSKFSDHSYNLNQIPNGVFGCIFFAVDERNKGYLSLNDWFYFNNLLERDNYHFIIMYEFFRKFDIARMKGQRRMEKSQGLSSINSGPRTKTVNYGSHFLSFDSLYLDLDQFKSTIKFLQNSVNDEFLTSNNLFLDWNSYRWLKLYQAFPYGTKRDPYLSLNSLITILQNDLKAEKLFMGFEKLAHVNHENNSLTLNKNQLVYLLKLFYSHRISADVFNSLNLTNTRMIKSDNNYISYNVVKDIFYLFQNFDLLNQVFIRYAKTNNFNDQDMRDCIITKEDLMDFLNVEYNKVNNIVDFSPSQINLLFSIVANSKKSSLIAKQLGHHEDSQIDNFIQNDFCHGTSDRVQNLKDFNANYHNVAGDLLGDAEQERHHVHKWSSEGLLQRFLGKRPQDETFSEFKLTMEDFMKIMNPNYLNDLVHQMEVNRIQSESLYTNFYFYPIFDSIYNFTLGSVAGCIGATLVYPIDLIKTRMQAQRNFSQYKNSLDCIRKIFAREGIRGIYSGLGPQLIGVAPEKAIKLTVNDYTRNLLMDQYGHIAASLEILAGASAGACQVIFTNPLEIVKIRMQVRSEYASEVAHSKMDALAVLKSLGFRGLYRGVGACLLRDVPFSAIYFPTYAHLKKDFFNHDPNDKNKRPKLKTWELLLAGGLAGMPAAFLTTPFDVIKTRLQIDPKSGETRYDGIIHAARTILKEESFRSFFKGSGARVLRSSPQFGFTLAAYEIFQNLFPLHTETQTSNKINEDTPTINNMFSSFFESMKKSSKDRVEITEFFGPSVDPYSRNYMNYYYKSCQVAKVFMDLDYNFSRFNHSTYSQFQERLKELETPVK
ncbi:LAMI_0D07030g1_1 [Lachancea mirantina]|uniref:Mitochondrial aspartate-glutamate transporter AGC1 n=1 Tax=Lachancea mirantina TaxID=1230905 RepID=A0A1G4JC48_9SACH|nr:LAMI_0D07030g1_1 [Lachancea mirantina]